MALAACLAGCGAGAPPDSTATVVRRNLEVVAGLPQDGITLGKVDAKATLTVFASLDASNQGFFSRDLPVIVKRWVRSGKLRVQLRTVTKDVDATSDGDAASGAALATAAGVDDHLWEFVASLTARYLGYTDDDLLTAALRDVPGIDPAAVRAAAKSARVVQAVKRADARASNIGSATFPAYVFDSDRQTNVRLDASCPRCLVRSLEKVMPREGTLPPLDPEQPTPTPSKTPKASQKQP